MAQPQIEYRPPSCRRHGEERHSADLENWPMTPLAPSDPLSAIMLRLGRVSNLPTVWTNVLAAVVLSGGDWRSRHLALLLISMSLCYVGGMYLNDYFDRAIDARERPERPIPSGAISASTVAAVGFALHCRHLALRCGAAREQRRDDAGVSGDRRLPGHARCPETRRRNLIQCRLSRPSRPEPSLPRLRSICCCVGSGASSNLSPRGGSKPKSAVSASTGTNSCRGTLSMPA
jgi:hypothetical protein